MSDHVFMTGMWHMAPSFEAAMPPLTTITGENLAWYLEEGPKALTNLGVDGLYFDGVYRDSVKNGYILLRSARELLGERRQIRTRSQDK